MAFCWIIYLDLVIMTAAMKITGCIVGLLVQVLVNIVTSSDVCRKEEIHRQWEKCDDAYSVTDMASIRKMCESVECLIQCKTEAVGDCAKREEFREHMFEFDPERWKVYYRYTCSNLDAVEGQFHGGCKDNEVCSQSNINFNQKEKDLNVLCSSLEKLRKCTSMSPDLSKNCTTTGAQFLENIRKLGYSISLCENTDVKWLYDKYRGANKCGGTSGTASVRFSLATTSIIIASWTITVFRKY